MALRKVGSQWYRLDGPNGVYASIRAVGSGWWGFALRRDDGTLTEAEVYLLSRADAVTHAKQTFAKMEG